MPIRISSAIFRPHVILLLTNLTAFACWLFPSLNYFRKGFTNPYPITSVAAIGYITLILLLSSFAFIGYKSVCLAISQPPSLTDRSIESLKSRNLYLSLIVLTSIGAFYSIYSITKSIDIHSLFFILTSGKANDIKYALYEQYSAGIPSLRYLSIYCGAFLLSRRLCGIRSPLLDSAAAILVILTSLISSRLTLVAAVFGGIYLCMRIKKSIKIKITNCALYIFIGILAVSALGWTRNSNFYSDRGLDFFGGSFSEIITYLGTPVQACMYAISNIGESYDYDEYHNSTTIETSLSTNSAFIELSMQYGWLGALYLITTVFFSSALIAYIERTQNGRYFYVSIPLIYSTSEIWRTFLFNQGLIITLLVIPLTFIALNKIARSMR